MPASSRPGTPSGGGSSATSTTAPSSACSGSGSRSSSPAAESPTGTAAVDELLTEADAEVGGALEELRALARGIHPAILTDEGLAPAIAALARRAPVPIELTVSPERLPEPVEATAYFVASEALANVAKHARASRATIALARTNGRVAIEVTDDGVGGADAEGTGLRGLRDRVEALDGHLEVETQAGGARG